MLKLNLFICMLTLTIFLLCENTAYSNSLKFNNDTYSLKNVKISDINKGYENEYFLNGQDEKNWTKMIGIYHYPEISDPIKYAELFDKEIEAQERVVLLKFIKNKKQDKAVISFLENGDNNGKYYFDYNIYKYEKHPQKGVVVLKYVKRYYFDSNGQITSIGHEVKGINDELLQQIIISPIPSIIER